MEWWRSINSWQSTPEKAFFTAEPAPGRQLSNWGQRVSGAGERGPADNGLAHYRLPLLPSESYADLSHPLGPGYALLAERIWEDYSSAGDTDKAIRKSER